MYEQDSESLDSYRESSAFDLAIRMARSKAEVSAILHGYGLSEEAFVSRFPVLAKMAQGLPDAPEETAPPL